MNIFLTGGAGFIGSAVVRHLIAHTEHAVLNVDKLTYAANLENLAKVEDSNLYRFAQIDICDRTALEVLFDDFKPDAVMHLAAESHVDRSIEGSADFIQSNIVGTYTLLEVARDYLAGSDSDLRRRFRFHHVSTDEVFGDLDQTGAFTEETPYAPSSPYSASKAASDHLVRAWFRTFDLPVVLSNCSNNYGPYQFPEKLIPVVVLKALAGEPIPVYGMGENVRDWLYVEDNADALTLILEQGKLGESYNVGGECQKRNIDMVEKICAIMDEFHPDGAPHQKLITFVNDRPGHDFRYALDTAKIRKDLNWKPKTDIDKGLRETVGWYLKNRNWWLTLLNR